MELFKMFSCFIFVIVYLTHDIVGLILTASTSPETAVFGNNIFSLTCNYTLEDSERLYYIQLSKQRDGENSTDLIFFDVNDPPSFQDNSLVSRITITQPWPTSRNAVVQFNNTICADKATYTWTASFYTGSFPTTTTVNSVLKVMAVTTFAENQPPSINPPSSLKEGDFVTFSCSGDIGSEPPGSMQWYYYKAGSSERENVTDQANYGTQIYNDTSCSYSQISSVVLKMRQDLNGITVRCEVHQGQIMKYKQTSQIPVQYGPRTPTVTRDPPTGAGGVYYTGDPNLNLTCSSDANPSASYYWIVPDGNSTQMVEGQVYRFVNLTEGNTGDYVCVAYNTINLVNYTVNVTVSIEVSMTTTTTTTTTPIPSSTESNGTDNPGGSTGDDDDGGTNTAAIVAPIVAAIVVIIIIIVVVVLCRKRCCKKEEIEEPPEKPRNNQDLTFYGNRPDLVTSELKNNQNNLNTSFSNSYDSSSDIKQREDGLNYIDLQFDDRPRSRKPIQLIDNAGVGYADIDLPRV